MMRSNLKKNYSTDNPSKPIQFGGLQSLHFVTFLSTNYCPATGGTACVYILCVNYLHRDKPDASFRTNIT